jgi:hypothetical protein
MNDHRIDVRVRRTATHVARAYSRARSFDVGCQVGLRETDEQASAVEYVLGALGGDLVCGFERAAEGHGLPIHAIEISLNGRLDNVLVHLGVIGEQGHPGFRAIEGTVYVSAGGDLQTIESAWQRTLARSPIYNTLTRCADVTIHLAVMP